MNTRLLSLACAAAVLAVCGRTRADSPVGENDWDPGPHNWTNLYDASLDTPTTGGNTGGWLRVTFPAEVPMTNAEDLVYTAATNLYVGAWSNETMWIQFDFWASNAAPGQDLAVEWQSTTNDYVWRYIIEGSSNMPVNTWVTFRASLYDYNDWQDPWGPGEAQYLADLQSVAWVGIDIFRGDEIEVIYGIDNFNLMIPEPAACLMVGAAMLGSAVALRRRKKPPAAG